MFFSIIKKNLPRKKAATIEDHYALDDHGRRRFHGAFTGGFSAGYFNSVDTRDGWRPQQFKSSRSNKAESISQRPEDFMDDEDTREFGIAPSGIRATSDFANQNKNEGKRSRGQSYNQEPIPGVPVLKELLKPVTDTVGVRLLKKMGWKPGQGVGLRLTKREKKNTLKRNEKKKVYSCPLPGQDCKKAGNDSNSNDDEDVGCQEVLFAPDDYEPFRCNPKDNYFGIDYSGLNRRSVLSGHVNLYDTLPFQLQERDKKLSIRGQAFGVGAFEADDEDIYAAEDMSRYDFTLGSEEKKNRSSRDGKAKSSQSKCIGGFVAGTNKLVREEPYKPPELSKNFKPIHLIRKSRFDSGYEETSNHSQEKLGKSQLYAEEKGKILGECTVSWSPQKEIAEVSQKSKCSGSSVSLNIITRTLNLNGREQQEVRKQEKDQKVEAASKHWMDKLNFTNFVCGGIEASNPITLGTLKQLKDLQFNCPYTKEKSTAKVNKSKNEDGQIKEDDDVDFIEGFTTDSEKQHRFKKYFDILKNDGKEKLQISGNLRTINQWGKKDNDEEFLEAMRLSEKKKSGESLSKFAEETSLSCSSSSIPSAANAAKMNMFGKLSRTVDIWQPASIICKRFNIPEPKSGFMQPELQKKKKFSVFERLDIFSDKNKFHKSVETIGSYKQNHITYTMADDEVKSVDSDIKNAEEVPSDVDSDLNSSKSNKTVGSFGASYRKVFGIKKSYETGLRVINLSSPFPNSESNTRNNADVGTESTEVLSFNPYEEEAEERKDLFKAIFLSSTDESESEHGTNEEVDSNIVKSLLIGKSVSALNVQRNTSPPRGIFAKLDLDDILVPGKITEKANENYTQSQDKQKITVTHPTIIDPGEKLTQANENKISNKATISSSATDVGGDILPNMYGPILPEKSTFLNDSNVNVLKPIFKSVVVPKLNNLEAIKWVEKTKAKKSKKDKKKHKHKEKEKKKHKSKCKR